MTWWVDGSGDRTWWVDRSGDRTWWVDGSGGRTWWVDGSSEARQARASYTSMHMHITRPGIPTYYTTRHTCAYYTYAGIPGRVICRYTWTCNMQVYLDV